MTGRFVRDLARKAAAWSTRTLSVAGHGLTPAGDSSEVRVLVWRISSPAPTGPNMPAQGIALGNLSPILKSLDPAIASPEGARQANQTGDAQQQVVLPFQGWHRRDQRIPQGVALGWFVPAPSGRLTAVAPHRNVRLGVRSPSLVFNVLPRLLYS